MDLFPEDVMLRPGVKRLSGKPGETPLGLELEEAQISFCHLVWGEEPEIVLTLVLYLGPV